MPKTFALALLIVLTAAAGAKPPKKKPARPPAPSAPALAPSTPEPAEPAPAEPSAAEPAAAPVPPAPAPVPSAPVPSTPPQTAKGDPGDLEELNREYHALRDELFRSRAKAELLGTSLFKTRISTRFQYRAQRAWPLKRVALTLDDQPVYAQDAPAAEDPIKLHEGFLAPGPHSLTVRVECGATGDSRLGYSAENTFTFEVEAGRQARVDLSVDETGDGPRPLAKKKSGEFDVRVRAKVRSLELNEK